MTFTFDGYEFNPPVMTFDEFRKGYKITELMTEKGEVFYLNLKHESPGKFFSYQATGLNRKVMEDALKDAYDHYLRESKNPFTYRWRPTNPHRAPVTVFLEIQREVKPDVLADYVAKTHAAMDRALADPGLPQRPTLQEGIDAVAALHVLPHGVSASPESQHAISAPTKEEIAAAKALGVKVIDRPGFYSQTAINTAAENWVEAEFARRKKPFWEAYRRYLNA